MNIHGCADKAVVHSSSLRSHSNVEAHIGIVQRQKVSDHVQKATGDSHHYSNIMGVIVLMGEHPLFHQTSPSVDNNEIDVKHEVTSFASRDGDQMQLHGVSIPSASGSHGIVEDVHAFLGIDRLRGKRMCARWQSPDKPHNISLNGVLQVFNGSIAQETILIVSDDCVSPPGEGHIVDMFDESDVNVGPSRAKPCRACLDDGGCILLNSLTADSDTFSPCAVEVHSIHVEVLICSNGVNVDVKEKTDVTCNRVNVSTQSSHLSDPTSSERLREPRREGCCRTDSA